MPVSILAASDKLVAVPTYGIYNSSPDIIIIDVDNGKWSDGHNALGYGLLMGSSDIKPTKQERIFMLFVNM